MELVQWCCFGHLAPSPRDTAADARLSQLACEWQLFSVIDDVLCVEWWWLLVHSSHTLRCGASSVPRDTRVSQVTSWCCRAKCRLNM